MIDTLIIGQGLAGSLLGVYLLEKGQRVLVVDDGHCSSSTKIAAGIMNPVVGQRLTSLWESDADRESTLSFYRWLEGVLETSLLSSYTSVRFLNKEIECDYFEKRGHLTKDATDYSAFVTPGQNQFQLSPVYRVDGPTLLQASFHYFHSKNSYLKASFQYDDLVIENDSIHWQGYQAKRVIFCEGAQGENNPYFKHLHFQNSFGHILELSCDHLPDDIIFNHSKWLCPIGQHTYKYGASSYWDAELASESLTTLETQLADFLRQPYAIQHTHQGTRPTFKNRQAFLGFHSEHPQLGFFNGLGGQGMALAPQLLCNLGFKLLNFRV